MEEGRNRRDTQSGAFADGPGSRAAAHPAKIDRAVEFSAVAVGLVSAGGGGGGQGDGGGGVVHPTDGPRPTVERSDAAAADVTQAVVRPTRD